MAKRRSPHAHGPSEIWSREDTVAAIANARSELAHRVRSLRLEAGLTQDATAERAGIHGKHLQRIERGVENATLGTLAALALALHVPLAQLFSKTGQTPFLRLAAEAAVPYVNCVPLYSLEAAAGRLSRAQEIEDEEEPESWVAPLTRTRLARGLFVARVIGDSMNRRIPNGAYCLFRAPVRKLRSGLVLLVQHDDIRDPEHGGRYTVKVLRKRGSQLWLEPDSIDPSFEPIALSDDPSWTALAEMIEVLSGGPRRADL